MTDKLRVENATDLPIWVPGGELEPGKTVSRPESEQLRDLLKSKAVREVSEEDERAAKQRKSDENDKTESAKSDGKKD